MADDTPTPAPDGTFQLVQHGPGGTPLFRLDISAHGTYPIGRDEATTGIKLTSPMLKDQHFAIRHDGEGLMLLINGETTLNTHAVTGEALLAHYDTIAAGPYLFTVKCLQTPPYPRGRIKNTLWLATAAAHDWDLIEEAGIMKGTDLAVNHTITAVQDSMAGHDDLESYLRFNHDRMRRQWQDFKPQIFAAEPLFGADEARITLATLTFMERPMVQLQYIGRHDDQLALAAWMLPPGVGSQDEAFARFGSDLRTYMRFH